MAPGTHRQVTVRSRVKTVARTRPTRQVRRTRAGSRPPDWHTYDALGERMQRAMGAYAYKPRELSRWGFFFRAQGTEIDHLYGRYGTLAFLIETTRSGRNGMPRWRSTVIRSSLALSGFWLAHTSCVGTRRKP